MSYAISIVSGGMDSATLAYHLHAEGYTQRILTFDYGQRHKREIDAARVIAARLDAQHTIIDLTHVGRFLTGSSLTDDIQVPDGRYDEETMRITVVPNRNAIMLSIAWGIAVAEQADRVATAVHGGDHHIYPDCRPEFIQALNHALRVATDGHRLPDLTIYAPYLLKNKTFIAAEGARLGVPFEQTWTCYKGGEMHCGTCGSCTERKEAFQFAGVIDPTTYLK